MAITMYEEETDPKIKKDLLLKLIDRDPLRINMILYIAKKGEANAGELSKMFNIGTKSISTKLKYFEKIGIIHIDRRKPKYYIYKYTNILTYDELCEALKEKTGIQC